MGGFDTQRGEHYGGDTQDGNGGQVEETDRAVGQAGNVPACGQITDGTGQRNRPCQAGRCADGFVRRHVAVDKERHGERTAADADPTGNRAEQYARGV